MATATKPEVNRSQVIREFVTKNPAMPISEVVTQLGKEGVKVSKNLVYMVKMKMKAKKAKEKKAKAAAKESQAATPSSNGSTKAPSKSSAVRAVLKGNRKMLAKEVVSVLAEQGITATEGLVYFVKGQMKGKRGQKKAQEAAAEIVATATATVATPSSNGDAVKTIMMVKGWAAQVGGMTKLAALVEALSD